jgi:predicted O-methyltransferase YrrM
MLLKSHKILVYFIQMQKLQKRIIGWLLRGGVKKRFRLLGPRPPKEHPLYFLWSIDEKYLSDWMLRGESLLWMWDLLLKRKPTQILELGSGWSTIIFAEYARMMKHDQNVSVDFLSIEHEQEWANQTRNLLAAINLTSYANILVSPLKETVFNGIPGYVYDLNCLQGREIDYVFVDGPLGEVGRRCTLPAIYPYMRDNAVLIMDDVSRTGEHQAVLEWLKSFPVELNGYVPTINGLAYLQKAARADVGHAN